MKSAEFFTALAKLKGKYTIVGNGSIRASEEVGYCPIVGVANLPGRHFSTYTDAACYLDLPERLVERIILAADNDVNCSKAARKRMLKVLGLQ